jgi:hypothetical protein
LSRLPGARRSGAGWEARCPAHQDRKASLSVGVGEHGRVLLHCFAGCEFVEIVRALGVDCGELFSPRDQRESRAASPAAPHAIRCLRALIDRLLQESSRDSGRIARYLLHRGLSGAVPSVLRYHPALRYRQDEGYTRTFPAILAPLRRHSGELVGLHRTYLACDGPGKAPVAHPKTLLAIAPGSTRGATVHLAKPEDRLAVAEGIETAIAILEAIGVPAWAAPSAGHLAAIDVPPHVTRVDIWADGDAAGLRAARQLDAHLRASGVATRILLPPRRHHVP